jgi:hypothetical protein
MKRYRLFLLSFITLAALFLSGFKTIDDKQLPAAAHSRQKSENPPPAQLPKPLDLSVPFTGSDKTNVNDALEQHPKPNLFATDVLKKPSQLQLRGQLLKTPDPEIEKRKGVDGAGIVIDIKP